MRMAAGHTIFEQPLYLTQDVGVANSWAGLGRVGRERRIDRAVAAIRARNSPDY
jgi:hypothetical protein